MTLGSSGASAAPSSFAALAAVDYLDVAAGENHACFLRFSGQVDCHGTPIAPATTLAQPPPNSTFVSVSAGEGITCGVTRSSVVGGEGNGGEIKCWADSSTNPLLSNIQLLGARYSLL
jgi:hypothetical protein